MSSINTSVFWFSLSAALWGLVFMLVPFRTLRSLLLPGFLMGFLWTFILNYPAVNWLKIYEFSHDRVMIGGVPLALALAWYGAMVLFFLFVLSYPRLQLVLVIVAAFATAGVFMTAVMLGHLKPEHLSVLEIMFVGLTSHVVALFILKLFLPGRIPPPQIPPLGKT